MTTPKERAIMITQEHLDWFHDAMNERGAKVTYKRVADAIEQAIIATIEDCAKIAENRVTAIAKLGVENNLKGEEEYYATAVMREAELIARRIRALAIPPDNPIQSGSAS